MTRLRWFLGVPLAAGVAALSLLLSCGSRTGIELTPLRTYDAGVGPTADVTVQPESEAEVAEAQEEAEVGFDAAEEPEALFPVDAIAPFDARIGFDSGLECPDGGLPTAYVLDDTGALYTFDPVTLTTTLLGTPNCGVDATEVWTLSVSREGAAYIVNQENWSIYKVDLTTLACSQTAFQPGDLGISTDYSIAVSRSSLAEKLYVYGEPTEGAPILAVTDLNSFVLTEVAPVLPSPPSGGYPLDMQADLFGHLFGLGAGGLLLELDTQTGAVIGQEQTDLTTPQDWAVMTYQDTVYLFWHQANDLGTPALPNQVLRYDIPTHTVLPVGTIGLSVLGASAVPCAQVTR